VHSPLFRIGSAPFFVFACPQRVRSRSSHLLHRRSSYDLCFSQLPRDPQHLSPLLPQPNFPPPPLSPPRPPPHPLDQATLRFFFDPSPRRQLFPPCHGELKLLLPLSFFFQTSVRKGLFFPPEYVSAICFLKSLPILYPLARLRQHNPFLSMSSCVVLLLLPPKFAPGQSQIFFGGFAAHALKSALCLLRVAPCRLTALEDPTPFSHHETFVFFSSRPTNICVPFSPP